MPVSSRLAEAAQRDPELEPYVELLKVALSAASDVRWNAAAAGLELAAPARLSAAEPVLHEATITLPKAATESLYSGLCAGASADVPSAPDLRILADAVSLRPMEGSLGPILQLTLLPALMAAGRVMGTAVAESHWTSGICPVCAAWPALCESRGLDRLRVLRCGRCGSEWKLPWQLCPFCANDDHRTLTYLYSEQIGESRRIFACDRCQGYLKTIATLTPIDPLDVPVEDVATLELDLAAIDAGRERPAEPGFEMGVDLRWES